MINCERSNFHGNKLRNSNEAPFEVHVLVVDGDSASLEITLGLLASLNYTAEGTKHPLTALQRVRREEGYFDLIVIDTDHLPDIIDGFQFKHKLDDHPFSIPLIMISMEKEERVMEKAINSGVVRYIVKPATESDFKGIWQYAVPSILMKANKKQPTISPPTPLKIRIRDVQEDGNYCRDEDSWSTCRTQYHFLHHLNDNNNLRKENNRVVKRKEFVVRAMKNNADEGGGDNNIGSSRITKKSKVVWTNDLQSRFLRAINIIGLENAVPKKILEVMNTPGLTRENVASHLQKYRLFLKRVARMFAMVMNNETENKKDVLTSLASKYPKSLMLKNIKEEFRRMLKLRKLKASSYKNPNSFSSNPLFKPSNKFQSHHHSTTNFSTQINPYAPTLHDKIPPSTSSYNYTNNFTNDAGSGFPPRVSSTCYDYSGNENSFINNGSNCSYLIDGRVLSPAGNNELIRANRSLADMEGNNNNSYNILENILEQQEKQYEDLNNGDFYQTPEVGGNNDAILVTSHFSNLTSTGFDICDNIMREEDDNCKFSNQQDNREVAGKDIDPRIESNNNDYFPSFDQISDEVLESLNLSKKDLENLNDLEQIPQDWADDFFESLFNKGV